MPEEEANTDPTAEQPEGEAPESASSTEVQADEEGQAAADDGGAEASDLAEEALAAASAAVDSLNAGDAQSYEAPSLTPSAEGSPLPEGMDLLSDVNLNVKVELGRTRMLVEDVLRLSSGAVVELDKLAGDPVDIYVNGRHVARGEVLVLNDNFCVRISEIVAPADAPVAEEQGAGEGAGGEAA